MSKQRLKLASLALAGLSCVLAAPASATGMSVDSNGGIMVGNKGDDHWFKISGNLQFDEIIYDGSSDSAGYPSGSNIRRARLGLNGGLGQDWEYVFRTDFSDSRSATSGSDVLDAYVTYTGVDNVTFKAGQFMPVIGMENTALGSNLWFMERSLATTTVRPGFRMGAMVGVQGETLNLMADVFHGNDKTTQARSGSEPLGYSARLIFVPVNEENHLWHFGASALSQNRHDTDGGTVTFATPHELTTRSSSAVLSTGALSATEYQVYGFEAAARWHDVTFQGEYFRVHVDRSAQVGGDLSFSGYYAQVAYSLTGERRPYEFSTGTFKRVSPVAKDGAWEVVARHSFVDLRDKSVGAPGSEHNTSVGVNWWLNDNISFAGNYVRANIPRSNNTSADIDAVGLRMQVNF